MLKNHPEVLALAAMALFVGFGPEPADYSDQSLRVRTLTIPEPSQLPAFGPMRPLVDVPALVREVLCGAIDR